MAESVSRLRATCFEIRRTPPEEKLQRKKERMEQAKKEAEKEYILELIPFGNVPHIPFDNIRLGQASVRTVIVRNATNKPVHVVIEKLPKAEKGFEVDYVDFTLGEKEEGQLKVGWVPQTGTPLRETVSVKFGKLKTQMLFVGTCKVPPNMVEQRKPLRPSSVQNLKRGQHPNANKSSILKDKLPANPVVRQPVGTCPPIRPYVAEQKGDQKQRFIGAANNPEAASWSPQPFRMADTFVTAHKEVFEEATNKENSESPRRDTFIVPKINDETINIRRETFITSGNAGCPMITSTPRCGPPLSSSEFSTPNSVMDRRQTYAVLPSTVKKPADHHQDLCQAMVKAKTMLDDETKNLYEIKEESGGGSNVDVNQMLDISGVDLSLSPEKKKMADLSGLDLITDQTLSLPPQAPVSTSEVKLQLSTGNDSNNGLSCTNERTKNNLSSETYVKDEVATLEDFHSKTKMASCLLQLSGIDLSLSPDVKKNVSSETFVHHADLSMEKTKVTNISSETYVKSDVANLADFDSNTKLNKVNSLLQLSGIDLSLSPDVKKTNISSETYVKDDVGNIEDFDKIPTIVETLVNEDESTVQVAMMNSSLSTSQRQSPLKSAITEDSMDGTSSFIRTPKLSMISEESDANEREEEEIVSTFTVEQKPRDVQGASNPALKLVRNALLRQVYERNYAAIIIQGCFRRFMTQKAFEKQEAAIAIQSFWRGCKARKAFLDQKQKVILIQSLARMMIARKKLLNALEERNKAATAIQKSWRCFQARQAYLDLKEKVTLVQSIARMVIARKQYRQLVQKRNEAAITIQKHFKKYLAMKLLQSLRENKAATTIQKFWRCQIAKQSFLCLKEKIILIQSYARMTIARKAYLQLLKRREEAAIIIQKNIRKHQAMNQLRYLKEDKAATQIQTIWKGFKARRDFMNLKAKVILVQSYIRMKCIRKEYLKKLETRDSAALTIQKQWRCHKARSEFLTVRENVILLQSYVRMCQQRQSYKNLLEKRQASAVLIQRQVRRLLAMRVLRELKEHQAATVLQKNWKCYKQRHEFICLRKKVVFIQSMARMISARKNHIKIVEDRQNAATIIQKTWRCCKARQDFLELKEKVVLVQSIMRMIIARKQYQQLVQNRQEAAITIQKHFKKYIAMKLLQSLRENKAATTIQSFWRCQIAKQSFLCLKEKTILIQSYARMTKARKAYLQLLKRREEAAIIIQKNIRKHQAMNQLRYLKENKAATQIQKVWKGFKARRDFINVRTNVIVLQSYVRMWSAKQKYQKTLSLREDAAIMIQKQWKCHFQQKRFQQQRSSAICIQSNVRMFLGRRKYQRELSAVLMIQNQARILHAKKILAQLRKENDSALILQRNFKRLMAMKQLEQMKKEHYAAVRIQKVWRGHAQRKQYLAMLKRVVKLQAIAKMILQKQKYSKIIRCRSQAATTIQTSWRGYKTKKEFESLRSKAILIQAYGRMIIARKAYLQLLKKREEAAIIIQKNIRKHQAMKQLRCLKENKAATQIQKVWRGFKARRDFMNLKAKVILVQSYIRMTCIRKEYLKKLETRDAAALTIQKQWRCHKARSEFLSLREKVILLQSYARMCQQRQSYKNLLEKRQSSAVLIQSQIRRLQAKRILQKLKEHQMEQNLKQLEYKSALKIQQCWRMYQARKTLQTLQIQYKSANEAAIKIQKTWRAAVARAEFSRQKEAIILLQSYFRMFLAKKQMGVLKNEALKREKAAIVLQHAFPMFKIRFWFLNQVKAATTIKAAWRGYKARQELKKAVIAKKLAEVQRRVDEAHKNVTEEKKLCNRTAFALDYLFTFKDMGQLIVALNNFDVTLRYSTNCCLRMFEEDAKAVWTLMELLNGLNRSVPHIEVMSIIFDILISLAEFHETRPLLGKLDIVYQSVLSGMNKGEKNADVFAKGCSLFWRLAAETEGKKLLKNDPYFKRLVEFEETQKRKKKPPSSSSLYLLTKKTNAKSKSKSLTTKHGCQLTESICRYHTDTLLAINVLMKRLRK